MKVFLSRGLRRSVLWQDPFHHEREAKHLLQHLLFLEASKTKNAKNDDPILLSLNHSNKA